MEFEQTDYRVTIDGVTREGVAEQYVYHGVTAPDAEHAIELAVTMADEAGLDTTRRYWTKTEED